MVRRGLGVLALIGITHGDAEAHCYSVWHYNYPQRCGGVYARSNRAYVGDRVPATPPIPVVRPPDNDASADIPLPDLAAFWVLDDTSEALQRLKAIRQLESSR
jgi:hypothetical protein